MLISVLPLAPHPLWRSKSLSDFCVSADSSSNFCLCFTTPQCGSSGSVRLFHPFLSSIFFFFLFFLVTLKKHIILKISSGEKIQCPTGHMLQLKHLFSEGRLMNQWGKLWRQMVPISSGMICWEKSFCHLKAFGIHAGVTRKEPLVHVYRGRCFMVISDLQVCNSGNLTIKTMWG